MAIKNVYTKSVGVVEKNGKKYDVTQKYVQVDNGPLHVTTSYKDHFDEPRRSLFNRSKFYSAPRIPAGVRILIFILFFCVASYLFTTYSGFNSTKFDSFDVYSDYDPDVLHLSSILDFFKNDLRFTTGISVKQFFDTLAIPGDWGAFNGLKNVLDGLLVPIKLVFYGITQALTLIVAFFRLMFMS